MCVGRGGEGTRLQMFGKGGMRGAGWWRDAAVFVFATMLGVAQKERSTEVFGMWGGGVVWLWSRTVGPVGVVEAEGGKWRGREQ